VLKIRYDLRNRWLLLTENGWILSPAYDINTGGNRYGIKLNISESDNLGSEPGYGK